MDGCPISFGASLQLPLNIDPISFEWTRSGVVLSILVVFGEDMDTSHVPGDPELTVFVNSDPETIDVVAWDSLRELRVDVTGVLSDPTEVGLTFDGTDLLFQSADGNHVNAFDEQDIQQGG